MTQQFLYIAQVRSAIQQMGSKRMPQRACGLMSCMPAQIRMYFSAIRPTDRVVIRVPDS